MPEKSPETNWEDGDEAVVEQSATAAADAPSANSEKTENETPAKVTAAPTPAAAVVEKDNFPTDLGEAFALLRKTQRHKFLGPNPSKEDKANHLKYRRLCEHVFKAQQGTPTTHVDATSKHAFIGLSVSDRSRWELEARTNPTVKKLLAAHDALAKENAELKKIITD